MRIRRLVTVAALALTGVVAVAAPAWAHPVLNITATPTTVTAGSNVTITIAATSNGAYSGARIDVSSTGGPGALPTFTSLVSCGGGVTCTEVGGVYRMAVPTLTNGQVFSYTITLTVDATTASTTFTPKAQFYKSDNTTDGPRTGPVITVNSLTTLTATPATTTVLQGTPLTITLNATNVDNVARTYRITSTNLRSYTTPGSCAGTPTATSGCTTYSTTGYDATVATATASSGGEHVSFTLNTTAVTTGDTVTAQVLVAGVVKATTTFTITVNPLTLHLTLSMVLTGNVFTLDQAITVTNEGPAALTTANIEVLNDFADMETTAVTGATCPIGYHSFLTCTIGALAPGASLTFHVTWGDFAPDITLFDSFPLDALLLSSTPTDPHPDPEIEGTCSSSLGIFIC